jgi:hypothetical protein
MLDKVAGYYAYATFVRDRPGKDFKIMNDINPRQLALIYPNEARIPFFTATAIQHNATLLLE